MRKLGSVLRLVLLLAIYSKLPSALSASGVWKSISGAEADLQKVTTCIAAATSLGGCLAAVSPSSALTSLEESDCCTRTLAFKDAECYW